MLCEFSEPVNIGNEEQDWEYSKMLCTNPILFELIENPNTEASFYLEKTFSYGDFFVVFYLTIFALLMIVKIIWNQFVRK